MSYLPFYLHFVFPTFPNVHADKSLLCVHMPNSPVSVVFLAVVGILHDIVTVATFEAIWLKWLLKDVQVEVVDPMSIYCDNLSSI